MKCTKCNQNEATVFYREIVNGKETKHHLCADCAAKLELENSFFTDPFGGDLLGSLFAGTATGKQPRKEEKKCTLCGATFRALAEDGKVGCPACYESFREELAPTLKRLHGAATHRGRMPRRFAEKRSTEDKIAALEKDLRAAIASEAYEDAARLRDAIRDLRAQ